MENIFLLIFLLSPILVLVGLLKPNLYSKILKRQLSRKTILLGGVAVIVSSFIGFGMTYESPKEKVIVDKKVDSETLGPSAENNKPVTDAEVSSLSIDTNNAVSAKVLRVIDGDTIEVSIDSKTEKVRVIGIDTPETVDPRKLVECFGIEASNKATELLKVGSEVYSESDPSQDNRDKYSRLLRYIWINENLDFGKFMIEEGYAYEYTYEIPYKYQASYKKAQKEAEADKKGLWADDVCIATPIPTVRPTAYPTAKPVIYIAPTRPPSNTSTSNTGGSWVCDCSKTCPEISSCTEAQYLLNTCGCGARDGDKDGIACDSAPLHCQN